MQPSVNQDLSLGDNSLNFSKVHGEVAKKTAVPKKNVLLSQALRQAGFTPYSALVDDMIELYQELDGRVTVISSLRFPHKFSRVQIIEFPGAGIVDDDLFQLGCGAFPKLAILKLAQNNITTLTNLHTLSKLRVLDLSGNNLETLPTGDGLWAALTKLQLLFLHDNQISESSSLLGLGACSSLRHITLRGNPVAETPNYRSLVMHRVPQIYALDEYVLVDWEQHHCEKCLTSYDTPEGARHIISPACDRLCLASFRRFSSFQKDEVSYGRFYTDIYASMKHAFKGCSKRQLVIYELVMHLRVLGTTRSKSSPSISIQKIYRGWAARNALRKHSAREIRLAIRLQAIARGWRFRAAMAKQREMILNDSSLLEDADFRNHRVLEDGDESIIDSALRDIQASTAMDKTKAAKLIQAAWFRANKAIHQSYMACHIQRAFRWSIQNQNYLTRRLEANGFANGVAYIRFDPRTCPTETTKILKFAITHALFVERLSPFGVPVENFCVSSLLQETPFYTTHSSDKILSINGREKAGLEARVRHHAINNLEDALATLSVEAEPILRKLHHELIMSSKETPKAKPRIRPTLPIKRRITGAPKTPIRVPSRGGGKGGVAPLIKLSMPTARALMWTLKISQAILDRPVLAKKICGISQKQLLVDVNHKGDLLKAYNHEQTIGEHAAIAIQSCWRSYHIRTEINIVKRRVEYRAAVCIQRFWRCAGFYRRMAFLNDLSNYLRLIDDQTVPQGQGSVSCLYLEYSILRAASDLGNETLNEFTPGSVAHSQEIPHISDVYFDCSNQLLQVQSASCSKLTPPPTHFTCQTYTNAKLSELVKRPSTESTCVRVGFPDWLNLGLQQSNISESSNENLETILKRGAVLTAGYITENHFERKLEEHSVTQVVRFKYRSRSEAMIRAAICFARTWDPKSRTWLPLVPECVFSKSLKWPTIPSSFSQTIAAAVTKKRANRTLVVVQEAVAQSPPHATFDKIEKETPQEEEQVKQEIEGKHQIANLVREERLFLALRKHENVVREEMFARERVANRKAELLTPREKPPISQIEQTLDITSHLDQTLDTPIVNVPSRPVKASPPPCRRRVSHRVLHPPREDETKQLLVYRQELEEVAYLQRRAKVKKRLSERAKAANKDHNFSQRCQRAFNQLSRRNVMSKLAEREHRRQSDLHTKTTRARYENTLRREHLNHKRENEIIEKHQENKITRLYTSLRIQHQKMRTETDLCKVHVRRDHENTMKAITRAMKTLDV